MTGALLTIGGVAVALFGLLRYRDKIRRARFWKRQAKRRERKLREKRDGGAEG
jgi:hypothetical protein